MDLLLVRCPDLESDAHASRVQEASGGESPLADGPAIDSMSAALSERGERHARRLAQWVRQHGPNRLQVMSSPAKSARQLAGLVHQEIEGDKLPVKVSRLLGPSGQAADILGAVGWPDDHAAALVVAHQPALGCLASLLIAGHEAPMPFKKGAIWWFSSRQRGGVAQTVLRCVLAPDLMKGGGRNAKIAAPVAEPPRGFSVDIPDVVDLLRMRLAGGLR